MGAYESSVLLLSGGGNAADFSLSLTSDHAFLQTDSPAGSSAYPLAAFVAIRFTGGATNDRLTVNFANGNPIPAGGVAFDGGGGQDTLVLVGTQPADSLVIDKGQVLFGNSTITSDAEAVQLGQAGSDVLLGSLVLDADAELPAGAGMVLRTSSLSITDGVSLDLADNGLIVDCADQSAAEAALATINAKIAAARNDSNGLWQGEGLTSSVARDDLDTIHGLGAIINNDGGAKLVEQVGSQHPGLYSVIVKYALNGDSDLNGQIDADDYFRMDVAYRLQADGQHGGYRNGEVDYRSGISADDFYLIDQAFVRQPPAPALMSAARASSPGPAADVLGRESPQVI